MSAIHHQSINIAHQINRFMMSKSLSPFDVSVLEGFANVSEQNSLVSRMASSYIWVIKPDGVGSVWLQPLLSQLRKTYCIIPKPKLDVAFADPQKSAVFQVSQSNILSQALGCDKKNHISLLLDTSMQFMEGDNKGPVFGPRDWFAHMITKTEKLALVISVTLMDHQSRCYQRKELEVHVRGVNSSKSILEIEEEIKAFLSGNKDVENVVVGLIRTTLDDFMI